MAVTVKFIADVVNWLSGLDQSEGAIEDNQEALADLMEQAIVLGRQVGKTSDEIAQDFHDAYGTPIDQAKRAVDEVISKTEDLGDAGEDAGRQLGDAGKSAGKDLGDGISDGTSRASDAVGELGNIAKDVLAGDFGSAAESAVGALGAIAAAAGVGGAVGGAIITGLAAVAGAVFAEWQKSAEQTEQRISDMYDAMVESGSRYLDAQFIQKAIGEITGNQDTYNQALAKSAELGVNVNDVILAMAGDQATLNALLDGQNDKRQDEVDAVNASNESLDAKSVKLDAINAKYGTQNDMLNDLARSQDSAGARFDAYSSASQQYLVGLINNASSATKEVDELNNQLFTLPDGKQILIEADTGQATTDLSTFKGDVDSKTETVTQTIKVVVDKSAWDNWTPAEKRASVVVNPRTGNAGSQSQYRQPL